MTFPSHPRSAGTTSGRLSECLARVPQPCSDARRRSAAACCGRDRIAPASPCDRPRSYAGASAWSRSVFDPVRRGGRLAQPGRAGAGDPGRRSSSPEPGRARLAVVGAIAGPALKRSSGPIRRRSTKHGRRLGLRVHGAHPAGLQSRALRRPAAGSVAPGSSANYPRYRCLAFETRGRVTHGLDVPRAGADRRLRAGHRHALGLHRARVLGDLAPTAAS